MYAGISNARGFSSVAVYATRKLLTRVQVLLNSVTPPSDVGSMCRTQIERCFTFKKCCFTSENAVSHSKNVVSRLRKLFQQM